MKQIKNFLILTLLCIGTTNVFAQSGDFGTGDALHWELSGVTLTISGTGDIPDYWPNDGPFGPQPWYEYRSQIEHVEIEYGATKIGHGAFAECDQMVSVSIPNSVEMIAVLAFFNCTSLASIFIPESVVTIEGGHVVFVNCFGLTSFEVDNKNPSYSSEEGVLFDKDKTVLLSYPAKKPSVSYTVPKSVTLIGGWEFAGAALTSIEVESGSLSYSSVDGVLFDYGKTTLVRYPMSKAGEYTIPDEVTAIGSAGFWRCSGLTAITIGNDITTIENMAFSFCTNLATIVIPESVTSMGEQVFWGCNNLASVYILGDISIIKEETFLGCDGLFDIYVKSPEPPEVADENAFDEVDTSECKLHVPHGSKKKYEDAKGWGLFRNIIEEKEIISIEPNALAGAVSVSPNPVTDYFYISGIEESTPITLLDVIGKVVLQTVAVPGEAVSVAHLPQGMYILQVAGETVKVIKN